MKNFNTNQSVYLLIRRKTDIGTEDVFAYSIGKVKEQKTDEILGPFCVVAVHEKNNVKIKKILVSHIVNEDEFKEGINELKVEKYFR